ncbi:hypothetical protein [Nocardia cyriacigeorgica]|uniref:hypothetical protein n=1 Tax=Nocardia cyriacigeorgica TaxID=135487 RepID=UPI002454FC27|nr:hypothetical protein [Nocardia cyriacigeorgica]
MPTNWKKTTITISVADKKRTDDAALLERILGEARQKLFAEGVTPTQMSVGAGLITGDQKAYEYPVHYVPAD